MRRKLKMVLAGLTLVFAGLMMSCATDVDVNTNDHNCDHGFYWDHDLGQCCPDGGCQQKCDTCADSAQPSDQAPPADLAQ